MNESAICPSRKELWLDWCLVVNSRGMESVWPKASATWVKEIILTTASMIEGYGSVPLFKIIP
jgi:hypothetical protein